MTGAPGTGTFLAFDTSGSTGHVAVAVDGSIRAGAILERRAEHAARLLPAVDATLREAGASPGDLAGLVVGEGPGSFTGVRVAAATAKGLAASLRIPLRPVSSLAAAAAASAGAAGGTRYALFDARGDRVYGACYRVARGEMELLREPHGGRIAEVLDSEIAPDAVFVGDGAARHRDAIRAAGLEVAEDAGEEPMAQGLIRALLLGAAPEVDDAAGWEPRYVRASSAERLWSL